MTECNRYGLVWCFLAVLLLLNTGIRGEDWPTYRRDNARTGHTVESLDTPLVLRWVHTPAYPPCPAWSPPAVRPREGFKLRPRVDFDDAFQVAAAGNLVHFGSSSDNKVYALDATTGEERWSFFAGGPVRLAPAVSKSRVFFGSDDGFAYCLKADDGQLVWRERGGPNDERLLGNGRMISRWPVRTGVLVEDGVAYFGAGIFPHENVYICAVRATDGRLVWRNDTISQQSADRNELSPQGYLLSASSRLFVPSGRALPVAFDRGTGKVLFDRKYGWRGEQAGGLIGGTYALLADGQVYTGTQNHLLALNQENGSTGFAWFPGRTLAVVGEMAYMATGRELLAMSRAEYARGSRLRNALDYRIKALRSQVAGSKGDKRKQAEQKLNAAEKELEDNQRENIAPTIRWSVPSACDAELIVTGNLVLAGGQNEVIAVSRDDGQVVWTAEVDGKARGLAVASGRLFVSTNKGKIYCFVAGETDKGQAQSPSQVYAKAIDPYPQDELAGVYRAAAKAILDQTGITKGYCLVLGAEQGQLAYELARRTELSIIGVEPDPEKVEAARAALDAAGLHGRRITIEQGDLLALPHSNYFANLIVSDSLLLTGEIPGDPTQIVKHLKPCGGAICLGTPSSTAAETESLSDRLSRWFGQLQIGNCRISETDGLWATATRGPLPGAGKWTHQYAEPGNTACSDDLILGGPLGLLWFGEPGPAPMVNRHNAAAAPLAVDGRLFVQGENIVMVYDSYNGVLQWKRQIPGAMRTRLKRSECGNLAASQDSLFVAVGDKCLRLEAETGRTRTTFDMPPSPKASAKWGYLAYVDGIVYGSSMTQTGVSDSVFALDAENGRVLWNYDGANIVNLTIAIGDGWVFFVDSSLTPQQRDELLRQDKSHLRNLTGEQAKDAEQAQKKLDARLAVALDARTGGRLWAKAVDVADCSNIGIGGGELSTMYSDGILVLCGANANGHYWRQFLAGEFSRRRLVALSAKNGNSLWAQDANYRHRPVVVGDTIYAEPWAFDLKTGEQKTRRHPLTGAQTPWQFLRPGHHCGAISACPQMLLMRSGSTAYYDLRDDSGIRHFAGHRPGCWINAVCADGLALVPEASAGCVCLFPLMCSVVLEPRADHDKWGIYSAGGTNTPVSRLAVNLGAPGDRRDEDGQLWLGFPRPTLPSDRREMGFSFSMGVEFLDGGTYLRQNEQAESALETDKPWLFASCARGLQRCVIPLLSEQDSPAEYAVRLYFAMSEGSEASRRALDVKMQGQIVVAAPDKVAEGDENGRAIIKDFRGIRVSRDLEIELVPKDNSPPATSSLPGLCGIEVVQEKTDATGKPVARK
jgi:outer membrane protein assembly factor BamB